MKRRYIITYIAIIFSITILANGLLKYLYPQKYSEQVQKYAYEYGIEESLVYAIIKCESNFNINAVSSAGAIGLMQITPETFEWAKQKLNDTTSKITLNDANLNIKYGCYIYSLFIKEFTVKETALASYNAGRGRVLSWLKDKSYSDDGILLKTIPYKETDNYVKKVIYTQKIYELIY